MVFGFSEDGSTCKVAIAVTEDKAQVFRLKVKTIGDTPYLFITGSKKNGGFLKVVNLTTMESKTTTDCKTCRFKNLSNFEINSTGTLIYFVRDGDVFSADLKAVGNSFVAKKNQITRCNNVNNPNYTTNTGMAYATDMEMDPNSDEIAYIISNINHVMQKINPVTCEVIESIGKGFATSTANTKEDSGNLPAAKVGFNDARNITVVGDKIIVSAFSGYIDEFDRTKFNATEEDEAWLQQMGGQRIRRWDGVKDAMQAIVNDSTLTTGAYFGFGHWNAGEVSGKHDNKGGKDCHKNGGCKYYLGWNASTQKSQRCNDSSCLEVPISPRGASQIMGVLTDLGTAWGTDAEAFSQMATGYFNDDPTNVYKEDEECQLNYVIVIGDGAMRNHGSGNNKGKVWIKLRL